MKMSSALRRSSGQGLIEYALILVLIAIIVIVAMTFISPTIEKALGSGVTEPILSTVSDQKVRILSDASVIKDGTSNPYLLPPYPEDYLYSWYKPGCYPLTAPPEGSGLKVGTIFFDPTLITVTKDGNNYLLCNNAQGAQVAIISAYVELPR